MPMTVRKPSGPDDYIRQMEQELQETREYLNNVIEELETANQELRSANEEAQSTNEEMQSTNEELETSKEEMQSLNEELETSNNELHRKIEEVTHINNDLNNFLQSTEIGILFLDRNLRIRRFSPQIKEIVSLQESDTGRSIQDFGINFLQEQLVEDVKRYWTGSNLWKRKFPRAGTGSTGCAFHPTGPSTTG
jgi:two-component system, chemotaxis family, CheB/CheR fusion protein